ncbi:hypothetical protein [Phytopseudomonas daroniae]|uniref:hypothetical protein n=1 Tax=Phytopseudomonas daroniae TaxID=2487519 RepID=UPI0013F176EC|nr:hypothetical protein [Pseudomonas daroniae]
MNLITNLRAASHRRPAVGALHSDFNLAGRLARYNAHMRRARALETMNVGG